MASLADVFDVDGYVDGDDDDVGFEVADVFVIQSSTACFSPILKPSSTKSVVRKMQLP